MKYFRTYWEHNYSEYATWFYSEVDQDGLETKRLEVFLDGRHYYYDYQTPDKLAEFPTAEDIQEARIDSEVHILEIGKEDFKKILLYHLIEA